MAEQNFPDKTIYELDNLDVLRGLNSETVDLIATAPPFNTKRNRAGTAGFYVDSHRRGEGKLAPPVIADLDTGEALLERAIRVQELRAQLIAVMEFLEIPGEEMTKRPDPGARTLVLLLDPGRGGGKPPGRPPGNRGQNAPRTSPGWNGKRSCSGPSWTAWTKPGRNGRTPRTTAARAG